MSTVSKFLYIIVNRDLTEGGKANLRILDKSSGLGQYLWVLGHFFLFVCAIGAGCNDLSTNPPTLATKEDCSAACIAESECNAYVWQEVIDFAFF